MPSEALSDLKIAQRACTRAGFPPIPSLSDSAAEAVVLADNLDSVIDDALGSFPWPFALAETDVDRLADDAPPSWDGLYALPADLLHLRSVRVNNCRVPWELYGGRIAVNAGENDEVRIEYTARVDASRFHPTFIEYLVYKLASILATGVAHDADRANLFETMAQRYFRRARWAAAKERTPRRLIATRLTGYR